MHHEKDKSYYVVKRKCLLKIFIFCIIVEKYRIMPLHAIKRVLLFEIIYDMKAVITILQLNGTTSCRNDVDTIDKCIFVPVW